MKTVSQLIDMKQKQTKISAVAAYDFPSAKQVGAADIDMILVGDSLSMTVLDYESTIQMTLADMIHRSCAVRRGAPNTLVAVDIPIGAVGISMTQDLNHTLRLYQKTSTDATRAEGAHIIPFIEKATAIGIPVVAHLGLTPQSIGAMGYKLQGTTKEATEQPILDARNVEKAGAVALILETIPNNLAEEISKHSVILVTDIGAGKDIDGQVSVYHDMLNYGIEHKAKSVKQFADFSAGVDGLKQYDQEVKSGAFPSEGYMYKREVMNKVNNND